MGTYLLRITEKRLTGMNLFLITNSSILAYYEIFTDESLSYIAFAESDIEKIIKGNSSKFNEILGTFLKFTGD